MTSHDGLVSEWCGWRWHTSVLRLFVPFLCLHLSCPALSPAQLQHGKKLIGFLQAGNL